MVRDGKRTREAMMDVAQDLIKERGCAGTSTGDVIGGAGVTKGAFCHHFKSKGELDRALIERYAELDRGHFEAFYDQAERMSRDPLQQLLIFVGLFQEAIENLSRSVPGCLFASYCYESQLFDDETLAVGRENVLFWRRRLGDKLSEVAEMYPPRVPIHVPSLADMMTVVFEGIFVLWRMLDDKTVWREQLTHYRNYLELLFGPGAAAQA